MDKKKLFAILSGAVTGLLIAAKIDSERITITEYDYKNKKVPDELDGMRIVQISDLHRKRFGKNQRRLIEAVRSCNPHLILLTGDIIDNTMRDPEPSLELIREAVKIADCYYVPGNHEAWMDQEEYRRWRRFLIKKGVHILKNEAVDLAEGVKLYGVEDPDFYPGTTDVGRKSFFDDLFGKEEDRWVLNQTLKGLKKTDELKILMSHRPERLDLYAKYGMDLVFCGHAHGGQYRIPFLGALGAPNQGFLPKLVHGLHIKDQTTEIISRGLGVSLLPIRFFCPPEIVCVTLHTNR